MEDPNNVIKLLTNIVRFAIALVELIKELIKNWPKGPRT